jgi:hypothetical protein
VIRRAAAAAAALGLALAAPAPAEDPKPPARVRVGLDPLRVAGVSPAFAEAVQDRLCVALGEVPGVDVTCPADVAAAALLARNAVVFGECQQDECLKRVDAVRSADRRVSGALERGEKGVVLSLQISGPSGPGPRVVERLPEDLDAVVARLPAAVRKLFP